MKNFVKGLLLVTVATLFAAGTANAQLIVKIRPTAPVVVRGKAPSPRHVWVDDEWVEEGGRYVRRPGHWALPPRPGQTWVAGRWEARKGGEVWIAGSWR